MKKSRVVTVGQTILIMAMVCLLMTADTHAQFQASSLSSSSFMLASQHQAGSTANAMATYLRLPSTESATNLSLAFTLIPVGLGLAMATTSDDPDVGLGIAGFGLFLGPSIGYFYGGCTERGLTGIGIRSLVALGTAIAAAATYNANHNDERSQFLNFSGMKEGMAVVGIGAALIAAVSLYDIARVDDAVKKQNQQRKLAAVRLQPSLSPDGQTWGMTLSLAF